MNLFKRKITFHPGSLLVIAGIVTISLPTTNIPGMMFLLVELMYLGIILIIFGMDQKCITITKKDEPLTKKDYFTVPLLVLIFIEAIVIRPTPADVPFSSVGSLLIPLVIGFLLFTFGGGTCVLSKKTPNTTNKK